MKTNRRIVVVMGLITLVGVIASVRMVHEGRVAMRRNDLELRRTGELLTSLRADRQRWKSMKSVSGGTGAKVEAGGELGELEAEAKRLRARKEELESENRRAFARAADTNSVGSRAEYSLRKVVTDSRSEKYKEELLELAGGPQEEGREHRRKDAQNLAEAARQYARVHNGEFPSDFELVSPYLFETYAPPRAHEFELVFHGSTNDLSGIPRQAVALVRQRQAWPTPAGKMGRIYVMADGLLRVVEAEDNFVRWEEAHVVWGRGETGGRD